MIIKSCISSKLLHLRFYTFVLEFSNSSLNSLYTCTNDIVYCASKFVWRISITQHLDSLILLQDKFKTPKFFKRWHSGIMIFPLNPRASYAIVYTISPCFFVFMYPSFRSISPYLACLCIHILLYYFTVHI